MPTLAETAVQIVAEGDGFNASLRQQIESAGASADRASRNVGRRVGQSISQEATRALSPLGRNLVRPLDQARASFDRLGQSFSNTLRPASRTTVALARDIGRLQAATESVRRSMDDFRDSASTALSFGRESSRLFASGLREIGVSASEANSSAYRLGQTLLSIGRSSRGALASLPETMSRIGSSLSRTHQSLGRFSQILMRTGLIGVASIGTVVTAMLALPAAASLAATTAAGAWAVGIAGIGIVAAAQSEEVQAAFVEMGEAAIDTFTSIAGPIERALISLAGDLDGLLANLAPSFERSFATLGPSMEGFFSEITSSLVSLGPLSEAAADSFSDLLEVLGPALGGAVERLASSLTELFESSDPRFFTNTVVGIVDFTASLIDMITWLSEARAGLVEDLAPAARALQPLFSGMGEGLRTAGEAATNFAGAFLAEAVPAVEALEPLMTRFGDQFSAVGDLISGFLSDISPALSALEPFVEGFVEGFEQAQDIILGFLSALLSELGPTEDALRSFAEWVGENEEIVRLMGVAVGSVLGVLAAYRIAALAASVASTLFSVAVRGIGVAIRSIPVIGWIIAGIGLLVVVIQQLWERSETFRDIVTSAWERVSSVIETAWENIQDVFDAFREAWDNVVEASQGDVGIGRIWDGIQDSVSTAWGVISPIFDQIAETWQFLVDLITGNASIGDAGDLISSYFSNVGEIGDTIAGFLIRQMERVPGLVLDALGFIGGTLAPWLTEQLAELPGLAVEGLTELGDRVGEWFRGLPERIERALGVTDGWLPWLEDLGTEAVNRLQGLGESIVEYMRGIPDLIRDSVDPEAILEWLQEAPGRIVEYMQDYGPQILKGLAIAIGIVVLGVPALLLGLLASILLVLGVIAWELIQWAWESFTAMMDRAGQAISAGIDNLVLWFQGLPDRLMSGVASLGARLATWGSGVITSLRTALTTRLAALGTWWNQRWESIMGGARGVWNTFVSWAGGAAGRLLDAIMGPIATLARRMVGAFTTARTSIERVWVQLRSAVGRPIEWVVNTVYNEWIRGVWGKVVDKFGGSKLPEYSVAFARGGVFPGYTPGRDVHAVPMAAFSGGESVLRPEITRAWGARTTYYLNKIARSGGPRAVRKALAMLFGGHNPFTGAQVPRVSSSSRGGAGGAGFAQQFSRGGIVSNISGTASDAWNWLNDRTDDFGDGMLDFLDDPKGVLRKIFDQVVDLSQMPGGKTGWTDLVKGMPRRIIEMIIEKAKELFSFDGDWTGIGGNVGGRLGAALAFAKAQAGKPYIWGGVGPRGYDCSGFISAIHNVILGRRPYSRRYTTHPFTGSSYGGFRRNMPSPFMIGVTHANVGHMAGTLLRTNVESRGSAGAVVGARARGYNNSLFSHRYGMVGAASTRNSRMGGEGILYDSGGWLLPGLSLIQNHTGKPESIRTWAQEKNVSDMVRLLRTRVALRSEAPIIPASRAAEFARVMGREGVGAGAVGGTVVNAPITVNAPNADPNLVARRVVNQLVQQAGV